MVEAKMSIVESRSDAQTLIDPVMKPVAVLSTIRNAAVSTDRRATEVFAASSVCLNDALSAAVAIVNKYTSSLTKLLQRCSTIKSERLISFTHGFSRVA